MRRARLPMAALPESPAPPGLVRDFTFAALLWLPTSFVAWYWLAPALQLGAWAVADLARAAFLSQTVAAIEVHGRLFEIVTRIPAATGAGAEGVLTFAIDPLVFAYGMPLFAGLTLASSGTFGAILGRLAAGVALLMPVQAFGVLMALLKMLAFDLASRGGSTLAWGGGAREAIALGYQLGSLVLPGVVALGLWFALNRDFVARLVPGLDGRPRPLSMGK